MIGGPVSRSFMVFDEVGDPKAGLVSGDFGAVILRDGSPGGVGVTVAEASGGIYSASFTPDAAGAWYLAITDPFGVVRAFNLDVTADDFAALVDDVQLIKRVNVNRLEMDFDEQTLVLYDDAGAAPILTWPIATDSGSPVTPFDGSQTKRGTPQD